MQRSCGRQGICSFWEQEKGVCPEHKTPLRKEAGLGTSNFLWAMLRVLSFILGVIEG